ncbi:hypothetical protein EVAR_22247_1 [Eumeta japonica]|uniref:Uncharacterized protein n=1 Tax=Eumeta variegata TaxID=151549 RepID=A0A4C1UAN9_EUMVA|nr:hypothetical protein EVAR_22247_1 [Eumeta japonica]
MGIFRAVSEIAPYKLPTCTGDLCAPRPAEIPTRNGRNGRAQNQNEASREGDKLSPPRRSGADRDPLTTVVPDAMTSETNGLSVVFSEVRGVWCNFKRVKSSTFNSSTVGYRTQYLSVRRQRTRALGADVLAAVCSSVVHLE